MKIENLRTEQHNSRKRVAATVIWENCGRPQEEVYFETEEQFADGLTCNPHAFLIGCIIPAMHFGEERVFIDAEICPELMEGLKTAMNLMQHWLREAGCRPVRIDASVQSSPAVSLRQERAGIFFSGGIDSFATMRMNRLNFQPEHPRFIKDGLLVFGLEQDDPELFANVSNMLSSVATKMGVNLIPVYTNLYLNYREEDAKHEFKFWRFEFEGAALASIAHAFSQRLSVVSIASTVDVPNLMPYGSHPLLDPNFSSSDMRIIHDGTTLTRFDKTKLIVNWDEALQNLRVCNRYRQYETNKLNCGQCEKCVRTMLSLEALGMLNKTSAFSVNEISAKLVMQTAKINNLYKESCYSELIEPLAARGRHDLVSAIRNVINAYRAPVNTTLKAFRSGIKKLDKRCLNGGLGKLASLVGK